MKIYNFLLLILVTWTDKVSGEIFFSKGSPNVKFTEKAGLTGSTQFSRDGRPYSSFIGIPFASIPERFGESELISEPTWNGYRDATQAGPICPQIVIFGSIEVKGDEDCLNLNVYVPMSTTGRKEHLPVLVYIHGGGFGSGNGISLGPAWFMDEEIIIVTINYRLGAFGFLSTGDDVVPGNNGLKDIVVALKWVQENIEKFGGNKNLVTVSGTSAGGAATSYLMLTTTTKGLMHRAISQSGAPGLWSYDPNPRKTAVGLATYLKCEHESDYPADITSEEILTCLKKISKDELVQAETSFKETFPPGFGMLNFVPVVESKSVKNPFLTECPFAILMDKTKPIQEVPWMMGITQDEGMSFLGAGIAASPELAKTLDTNWNDVAPTAFCMKSFLEPEERTKVAIKLREFYFGDKAVSYETRKDLYDVYSDSLGNYLIRKAALQTAARGEKNPVYLYQYSYLAERSMLAMLMNVPNTDKVVTHGDDIFIQFDMATFIPGVTDDGRTKLNEVDEIFSKNYIRLLVKFAKEGEPNHTWGDSNDIWTPVSKEAVEGTKPPKWYNIASKPGLIEEPFTTRMNFWDALWKEHFIPKRNNGKTKTEL